MSGWGGGGRYTSTYFRASFAQIAGSESMHERSRPSVRLPVYVISNISDRISMEVL
jgi:hypothetical protein